MRKLAYHLGMLLLFGAVACLAILLILTDEQGWGLLAFAAALMGCAVAK
jgi:hypothetical protein